MKFKQSIKTLALLLAALSTSVSNIWAQEPSSQSVYLAAFKAQTSSESTGSGQVKVTWVDAQGELFDNTMVNFLNQNPPMSYGTGNPSNGNAFSATAMVIGATLTATESVEDSNPNSTVNKVLRNMLKNAGATDVSHLFMTPFAYFRADAVGNNGSYFLEWTFNDPKVTRQDTAMDKSAPESAYFKVLPNSANVFYMIPPSTTAGLEDAYAGAITNSNNIYAVFKKFILSNPQKNTKIVGTASGSSVTLDVSVDVEGDVSQLKENYADFAAWSFADYDANSTWTCAHRAENPIESISANKKRYHYEVTYMANSDISEGAHTATLTISMAGANASTLNIPLSVFARPASANEASVKIGNAEPVEYATLSAAVAAANGASGDIILTLLKDVAVSNSVVLTNTITLDLNGYTLSAAHLTNPSNTYGMIGQPIVIINGSGKTVTLAYNKLGGAIEAAPKTTLAGNDYEANGIGVDVAQGKLVLNGGTISSKNKTAAYDLSGQQVLTIAVKIESGAELIQNGATIKATSNGPKAFGIYNDGTVTINDGSISAEADFNIAMAVMANDGSVTAISGGSLYSLAKEATGTEALNQNLTPEAIATWTNSYAVNAQQGSTVNVNGGELLAEAINASRAYAVACLAGFGGTINIDKKPVIHAISPNNMYSFPLAILGGPITINGGKYFGECKSRRTGNDTICPPVFGVDYTNVTFKSGYSQTETFFQEDDGFPTSKSHPTYKNYNIIRGSKDYEEGFRYIAVAEDVDPAVAGVPAARIGTVGYATLEDAIAYANNNLNEELVIFMMRDYTLPAGYYTLPAKATLVIPMSDEQAKEINKEAPRLTYNDIHDSYPYVEPKEFRRLTFASGVNLEVFGDIEMTCTQIASNESYTSQPTGDYGRLVMEEGSHITLQSGSELRAWGFMTGKGETDARRGAKVREMFQMGDWKGAMTSVYITGMGAPMGLTDNSRFKIFPVTQYFIQNIESPVKYHPGAVLSTSAAVSEGINLGGGVSVTMCASDIKVVGVDTGDKETSDQAIFLMDNEADADNTWVRKWYDAEHDIQTYDINSGAHIGSMVLDMGSLSLMSYNVPVRLNSAMFDLPITTNMKIHLLSGTMDFKQNTCLLPGSEVEVDKESVVSVAKDDEDTEHTGALYVFDKAEWGQYAYNKKYTKVVRYAPSANSGTGGSPSLRNENICPPSAAINVHGTFNTSEGYVYTSASGANIFSSNDDAGTFIFNEDASEAGSRAVYQIYGLGVNEDNYKEITFTSAQLTNGNGTHESTTDAVVGDAYCYKDNLWTIMKVDEDNPCFMVDNHGKYYAKPAEYVAINATKIGEGETFEKFEGNEDHTFSDAAGAGRLFILTSGCQWWEVENVDNLYHCIHPENDTYYYWDDTEQAWMGKKFTITWKNWDGAVIKTKNKDNVDVESYEVTYGTMAEFLGTNPTREPDIDYTYDFTGWSPELGPVTSNVTYTATYEKKERKYTITFLQEGGAEIERQFLPHNAVPICENTPTKVGHILQWDPAISPVIKDQTYTATWLEELPDTWEVSFADYDGTLLKKNNGSGEDAKFNVPVNGTISSDDLELVSTPTKKQTEKANAEFNYEFDHWMPATTEPVTQPTIYTAVYREVPNKYTIYYFMEDGETPNPTKPSEELPYGATPTPPAVSKENPETGHTYTLVWKTLDESGGIQTVMGEASYKPTYLDVLNKYTVTLVSSVPGAATFTGAGIYKYGETADITITANSPYTFIKWDDESTERERSIDVKDDITLTAIMRTDAEDETVELGETFDGAGQTVKNLILKSNTSQSGEITGASSLKIDGQAYFDLTLNAAAQTWYAFAVPWKVDATSGVSVLNGAKLVLDKTYHVLYYDGANRAAHGKAQGSWKFLADKADKTLEPGVFYLIYLNNSANTLRFTKKAGASINTISVMVQQYPSQTGDDADANWNGIANPAVYRAYMNAGVDYGQPYESGLIEMSSHEFIVGEPIFVQVPAKKSVVAVDGSYPAAAPSRWLVNSAEEPHQSFDIRIAAKDADYSDRLFVKTATDKADKYIIGQDLAKISVSKKAAQFWVDRYDAQLCVNTQAVDNDQAFFPLGIFAPTNGQYTISSATALANNEELFVTIDGTPVWNLGAGAYTIDLAAGNTTEYGLMVVYHPAPEVTTGCENIEANNAPVRKVLINGQVFILRDGAVYTIFGQKAK